jgi:hypothetical protein
MRLIDILRQGPTENAGLNQRPGAYRLVALLDKRPWTRRKHHVAPAS